MNPKVSILIPCYNAERYLAQAIESAFAQTYPEKEVIVADDGSTDRSLEIIKGFGDKIAWETGPNRGANAARNRLLELSKGEWLQYLDADDYLLPGKVENHLNYVRSAAPGDVIYSQVLVETEKNGKVLRESAERLSPLRKERDIYVNLARWNLPQTGGVIFRKKALVEAGGWKENQPCCQEHELYLRLLMAGKRFVFCEDEEAVYRLVGESTLSRADPLGALKERMRITDRLEGWLETRGMLNPERQRAVNMSRFECARGAYGLDKNFARGLIEKIKRSDKKFVPIGSAAPPAYRLLYKTFGFTQAERMAKIKRKLFKGSGG